MYVRDLLQTVRRRWYLVPLVIAAAIGCGLLALDHVGPQYRGSASVVLVPPETTLQTTGNPYLFLGGLEQSVDVLSRTMGSQRVRESIKDDVPAGDYTITSDVSTSAPIVLVETEASSADGAELLLSHVLLVAPTVLSQLQSDLDVPKNAKITTQVIARSTKPLAVQKTRYRLTFVAGGAGFTLGLLLVFLLDGLLLRRRHRATRAEAPDEAAAPVEAPDGAPGPGDRADGDAAERSVPVAAAPVVAPGPGDTWLDDYEDDYAEFDLDDHDEQAGSVETAVPTLAGTGTQ